MSGFARILFLIAGSLLMWRAPHVSGRLTALHSQHIDTVLSAAAELALIVVCAYALFVIVGSWRARHSRHWAALMRRSAPTLLRACMTVSIAGGIGVTHIGFSTIGTAPASAMDSPQDVHGVPYPDRPLLDTDDTPPQPDAPDQKQVTVRPGDSLWAIAAGHLGRGASHTDIEHAWRSWWHTNRSTIGADPHLIRPGQTLHSPPKENP